MEQQAANPIASFLPLILIFVVFYFLLIRPQQKQKKQHENMVKNLGKNDEVVTSSGIYGTILNVKDSTFIVRIDDNTKIEIEKYSIAHLKKKRAGEETAK
ncbi:MAG: preprotein translocase subunit YajC [Candidatus Omnitrophota bacterium]